MRNASGDASPIDKETSHGSETEYTRIERLSRKRASRFALTTETRYRCVVIYNDYRLGPDPGGWFLSPDERGNEGGTTTQRGASAAAAAFPWLWITSRPSRIEPSFPICVEPDTPAKGREIKIYCATESGRVGEPPPRRVALVDVDVDSRTPSPSIERTSLFPPFSYIGSAAVIAQSIARVPRAMRLSGWIFRDVVLFGDGFLSW